MKILQIVKLYHPWIGGVEKITQQIAEGLNNKNSFKINVLCCQAKGKEKKEEINGVKVLRASSLGIFSGMPVSFSFFKLFKKLAGTFDLIDFHHPFPLGNLAFFIFRPRAKLVVHYHSDIVRQRFLGFLIRFLILDTLKKAQKIIVSNPNLIKNSPLLKNFKKKCQVIPFGVEINKFEKHNEKEIAVLKKKYGDFVLFVGRLNYYKKVEYLIEAMKNIKANLVIVGEGSLQKKLEHMAKQLGIGNRVFFFSPLPERELINFYQACSIFVLPSVFKSEAFGIVLIEAMASGKPVISTELGTGTSWVNIDGETGFVVSPRNPEALAGAINRILTNKKLTKEFSQNALARVKKLFSLKEMLFRTSEVYKNISNT